MNNTDKIVRRRPTEPLPALNTSSFSTSSSSSSAPLTAAQRLSMPSGVQGLCPELMDLFSMTMTADPLPFPSLRPSFDDRRGSLPEDIPVDPSPADEVDNRRANDSRSSIQAVPPIKAKTGHHEHSHTHSGSKEKEGSATKRSRLSAERSHIQEGANHMNLEGEYMPFDDVPFDMSAPLQADFDLTSNSFVGANASSVAVSFANIADTMRDYASSDATSSSSSVVSAGERSTASVSSGASVSSSHESKWGKKTKAVMDVVRQNLRPGVSITLTIIHTFFTLNGLQGANEVTFGALAKGTGVTKRVAATSFMELLQLQTWGRVELEQTGAFADITIRLPDATVRSAL
jgi:hypothetical protein